MKTSFVSTNSVSQTMRYRLMRMQAELADRQQEAVTGRVADPGLKLGAGMSRSVSMSRDVERLNGLLDSNSLASNRLAATQDALDRVNKTAQDLLSTLAAATSGSVKTGVVRRHAVGALESLTGILNTSFNGEYLFAGINTDVKPIRSFTDNPPSDSKTAFDAAFLARFGFSQSDPAAANITAGEITDFLDNDLAAEFQGAGWSDNWSDAADQPIVSRITLNETEQTSVTANNEGVKKLLRATAAVADLLKAPLNGNAKDALIKRATGIVGEGISDIVGVQGRAGIAENRVSDASERISSQVDLFKSFVDDVEGVDPYEAATRVNDLMTQIETSYTLTSRIQQLSLVRYLP